MPIDPSIPLRARAPQMQSPLESYGRMMQIKNLYQYGKNLDAQGRKLAEEEAKRQQAAKAVKAYSELMRKHTTINDDGTVKTNPAAIRSGLIEMGYPDIAQKYEEGRLKSAKALSDLNLAELKEGAQQWGMIGQLSGGVVDAFNANPEDGPAAYSLALRKGKEAGLDFSSLPPVSEFTPDIVGELEMFRWLSLGAKEQIDLQIKKSSPKTTEDWLGLASRTMGSAKGQVAWDKGLGFLKAKKVPEDILALIDEQYSPEAAERVAQLGLTPFQQQPDKPSGDFERHYLPGWLKGKGITNPTDEEMQRAYLDFKDDTRAPKAEGGKSDEQKDAEAHSAYLTTVNKYRQNMEQEIEELLGEFPGSRWATVSKTGEGMALSRKYSKLFKAAAAEYRAVTGKEPPQDPVQRSSQPQGPGAQPASRGTVRKRYNPQTRKLETY